MIEFQQISKHQDNKHLTNAAVFDSHKCEHCSHHHWKATTRRGLLEK